MFQSNNPALSSATFGKAQTWDQHEGVASRAGQMTLQGTINAAFILLGICLAAAVAGWGLLNAYSQYLGITMITSGVLGLIAASFVVAMAPRAAAYISPLAAACLGIFGAAASIFWSGFAAASAKVPAAAGGSIIFEAVVLTIGLAAAMLIAYTTGIIRPAKWLLTAIVTATGGVFLFMIAMLVISFFNPGSVGAFWTSPLGLGIAFLIVGIATFNLVVDFHQVEQGVRHGAPKYMEWAAALGLLITLVWMYVSILRLLALLAARE